MSKDGLQVIWEQLNGAMYDLTEGDPADAVPAIEDCIARLEAMGVNRDQPIHQTSTGTNMPISTTHENNFSTLCEAMRNNDVALMLCTDAKTGEDAVVICMVNRHPNDEMEFVPVATMIEGNPYEAYIPPSDPEYEESMPNNVSPTDADTKH
jgi:hypothetical protein